MIGPRPFYLAGIFIGFALLVFAREVASALRRRAPAESRTDVVGVALLTGVIWWVRFVGAAFVVVGCAYLVDPGLAD